MITEVNEENGFVVVDTNHPLAGMTLEFDVTVVAVRDAPATAGCGQGNRNYKGIGPKEDLDGTPISSCDGLSPG